MKHTRLMTSKEMEERIATSGIDRLAIAIEKWERAGLRGVWNTLRAKGGAYRYLMSDTCPLCNHHKIEDSNGPKKWEHCLSSSTLDPCPLVEEEHSNTVGCTSDSPWRQAYEATKCGNRPAFMKARAKILRRLRAARKWY